MPENEPQGQAKARFEHVRYDYLPLPARIVFIALTVCGVALATVFMLGYAGRMSDTAYYYILFAIFGSAAFLILPLRKSDRARLPWYDILITLLAFGIPLFFCANAFAIQHSGWMPPPQNYILAFSLVYCLIMLEAARRMGGLVFFLLCLFFWLYPLYANHMPGFLYGMSWPWDYVISFCTFGGEGIIGLPGRVMGQILIGFLIFAGMLIASGAGDFFLNMSLGMLGRYRGGPAKVAILSSGFFGSLSGSVISNIVSTGSITIPAMKRMGYPAHYAGAIEACASTGGVLMPPVMGVVAFVMAIMTQIEYAEIIKAAAIPAILFYFGLMVQVDAYAAKTGLKGLPRNEIPSKLKTFKECWTFVAVLIFLVWGLLYMRWSAITPFYAAGLLFLLSFSSKRTALTPRRLANAFAKMGILISQTMALILPFAFILAGMVLTGMSSALTAGIVGLAGGNVYMILLLGIVACYLLGIMGMDLAAYIFLAVSMAPALVNCGLNVLAVHLFIVYYSMLAAITPPVAIGVFVASALAGSSPMKTGLTAMRLGSVIYFTPLFFIFNPELILQGPPLVSLYLFIFCIIGIWVLAGGLEGYMLKVGEIRNWARPLLAIGGLAIAYPDWYATLGGFAMVVPLLYMQYIRNRRKGLLPIEAEG